MPIPRPAGGCHTTPARTVSLTVVHEPTIRKSRMGKWRALVLIGVHLIIAIHILQWVIFGMTLSPVEPSESMYSINQGKLNAGFVFFALAILSTLILGRFFCGWGCHIVALQDLCGWAMKKAGIKPKPFRSRLLVWAPVVLAVYMFAWPTIKREVIRPIVGESGWAAIGPYLGEVGERPELRAAFLTENFWETFPPWYVAIPFLIACGFACVYFLGAKGFCTYGCPYGGIFGPADLVAPGRIRVTDACEHCGHCTAVCTSNVRVHEEVRDFGMVVDPGCMKCMDCISVCPNDALYFGFGRPALGAKPRTEKPANFKSRVFDLSWKEELAYGAVFLALVVGFRGMFNLVPLLMSMGIAGISTYLIWKTVSLVRVPNVRIHGWQLRLRGRVTGAGVAVGACAVLLAAAGAWGLAVNASVWRGNSLDARLGAPLERVLSREYHASSEDYSLAAAAAGHLRRAGAWRDGGIGWDRSVDRAMRLTRLEVMLGRHDAAESVMRASLRGHSPPPAQVEDALIRLLMLRASTPGEAESKLRELAEENPELASVKLGVAGLLRARGASEEAGRWVKQGMAARPGDARNALFAADLLAGMERLDDAVAVVRRAADLNPRTAALRERLGLLLAATGKVEDGLRELKVAAELDPGNEALSRHIAAVLREMGRESEATEWDRRTKGINPGESPQSGK